MENQSNIERENSIVLSNVAISFIYEASKWAKFLAILGFIFVGLIAIGGLLSGIAFSFASSQFSMFPFPPILFSFVYLLLAILYFFPALYLYNFSTQSQKAIVSTNGNTMDDALKNLKSHFKFIGIMAIIVIALYIIGFILAVVMGSMLMNSFM